MPASKSPQASCPLAQHEPWQLSCQLDSEQVIAGQCGKKRIRTYLTAPYCIAVFCLLTDGCLEDPRGFSSISGQVWNRRKIGGSSSTSCSPLRTTLSSSSSWSTWSKLLALHTFGCALVYAVVEKRQLQESWRVCESVTICNSSGLSATSVFYSWRLAPCQNSLDKQDFPAKSLCRSSWGRSGWKCSSKPKMCNACTSEDLIGRDSCGKMICGFARRALHSCKNRKIQRPIFGF